MDEIEARLAALELLAIERLALDHPPILRQLRASLVEGFPGLIDIDERMVREQAVKHVEDAERRHLTFTAGDLSDND